LIIKNISNIINRFEETITSKEILIQAEKQEHEGTKKLLKESYEKNEELMDKIKEANKRADRIQDHVERYI
jgi:Na+-translocating ferredoxin:NAD+ oxidoreductase RnfG subunit